MLYIVTPPGIQYEGETREQAFERDRRTAEHNAAVDRELAAWKPSPMKGLSKWDCCCPCVGRFSCDHPMCPRTWMDDELGIPRE